MDKNRYFKSVLLGIVTSLIIALVGIIILSAVMSKVTINKSGFNMIYAIILLTSLVLGTIAGTKKNKCKGYLVGIGVSLGYFIVINIISLIAGGGFKFSAIDFLRFIIVVVVGILSGMIGVNTNS